MSLCEVPGCTDAAQYPKIDGQPNAIRARWCDRHALERYPGVRTPLTKQDIDALVDGMPEAECNPERVTFDAHTYVRRDLLRSSLYLAAGLTAEGERKPERVRCWLWQQHSKCDRIILVEPNCRLAGVDECFTPGTFVPDEA